MYKVKNKIYADAGNILIKPGYIGFECIEDEVTVEEKSLDLTKLSIINNIIKIDGYVVGLTSKTNTYEEYKTIFVKKRYSNDDQIAIMLNKDESEADLERFQKMQEWREWSGNVAKVIIEKVND